MDVAFTQERQETNPPAAATTRTSRKAAQRAAARRAPGEFKSLAWGTTKLSLLSAISLGFVPAFIWPSRFRELADDDASRLRACCASLRDRGIPESELRPLEAVTWRLDSGHFLSLLTLLLTVFVAASLLMDLRNHSDAGPGRLADVTYSYAMTNDARRYEAENPDVLDHADWWTQWQEMSHLRFLHLTWSVGLTAAYLVYFFQVRAHRGAMRQFLSGFNELTQRRGGAPIRMHERPALLQPLALIAGLFFLGWGAWWAIPMLLAGSTQNRYILISRRAIHAQLTLRVAAISPATGAIVAPRRCANESCMALMPSHAAFCPRCGGRVSGTLDEAG